MVVKVSPVIFAHQHGFKTEVEELLTDPYVPLHIEAYWERLMTSSSCKEVSLDSNANTLTISLNKPVLITNIVNLDALFHAVDKKNGIANVSALTLINCQFNADTWESLFTKFSKLTGLRTLCFNAPTIEENQLKRLLDEITKMPLDSVRLTFDKTSYDTTGLLENIKKHIPEKLSVEFKFSGNDYSRLVFANEKVSNSQALEERFRRDLYAASTDPKGLLRMLGVITQNDVKENLFEEYVQKFGSELSFPYPTTSNGESFLAAYIQAIKEKRFDDHKLKEEIEEHKVLVTKSIIDNWSLLSADSSYQPQAYSDYIKNNNLWADPVAIQALLVTANKEMKKNIIVNTYKAAHVRPGQSYELDENGFISPLKKQVEQIQIKDSFAFEEKIHLGFLYNQSKDSFQGMLHLLPPVDESLKRKHDALSFSAKPKKTNTVSFQDNAVVMDDLSTQRDIPSNRLNADFASSAEIIQFIGALSEPEIQEKMFADYVRAFGGELSPPYPTKSLGESFLVAFIYVLGGKCDLETLERTLNFWKIGITEYIQKWWDVLSHGKEAHDGVDPKAYAENIRDKNLWTDPVALETLLMAASSKLQKQIILNTYRADKLCLDTKYVWDSKGFIYPIAGQVEQHCAPIKCEEQVHLKFLFSPSQQTYQAILSPILIATPRKSKRSREPLNGATLSSNGPRVKKTRLAEQDLWKVRKNSFEMSLSGLDTLYEAQKKDRNRSDVERESEFIFEEWSDLYLSDKETWEIFGAWLHAHPEINKLKFKGCDFSKQTLKELLTKCDKSENRFEKLTFIKSYISSEAASFLQKYFKKSSCLKQFEFIEVQDKMKEVPVLSTLLEGLASASNLRCLHLEGVILNHSHGALLSELIQKHPALEELKLIKCLDSTVCRQIADATSYRKGFPNALRKLDLSQNILSETDLAYLLKSNNRLEEVVFPPSYSIPLLLEATRHPTLKTFTSEVNDQYCEEFLHLIDGARRKPEWPLNFVSNFIISSADAASFKSFVSKLKDQGIYLTGANIFDDDLCDEMVLESIKDMNDGLENISLITLLKSAKQREDCLEGFLSNMNINLGEMPACIEARDSFFASLLLAVEGADISELPEKTLALKRELKEEVFQKAQELHEKVSKASYLDSKGRIAFFEDVEEFLYRTAKEGSWGNSIDVPLVLSLLNERYKEKFSLEIWDIHAYDAVMARHRTANLTPIHPVELFRGHPTSQEKKLTLLRSYDPLSYVPVILPPKEAEPVNPSHSQPVNESVIVDDSFFYTDLVRGLIEAEQA